MSGPTHIGPDGAPRMVDVSAKPVTTRRASATATVRMRPDVLAQLVDAGGPKGDALVTARLAGIGAAKRTSDLIPLCHPLPLDSIALDLAPDREAGTIVITADVATEARTGVEMEALTAASVAALTIYDMAKALQRDISIERIELLRKSGGVGGDYDRDLANVAPPSTVAEAAHEAVVLTCSTRGAAGTRPDTSGAELVSMLQGAGVDVDPQPRVVADDEHAIASLLRELADAGHRLVLTTGGTGLSPTDVTPAATRRVVEREAPGLAELMRAHGLASTPMASLSGGVVGVRGTTLIANLPGSPRGARESLEALLPVLQHALDQIAGEDH